VDPPQPIAVQPVAAAAAPPVDGGEKNPNVNAVDVDPPQLVAVQTAANVGADDDDDEDDIVMIHGSPIPLSDLKQVNGRYVPMSPRDTSPETAEDQIDEDLVPNVLAENLPRAVHLINAKTEKGGTFDELSKNVDLVSADTVTARKRTNPGKVPSGARAPPKHQYNPKDKSVTPPVPNQEQIEVPTVQKSTEEHEELPAALAPGPTPPSQGISSSSSSSCSSSSSNSSSSSSGSNSSSSPGSSQEKSAQSKSPVKESEKTKSVEEGKRTM